METVNYLREKLNLSCLTWFLIRLWFLHQKDPGNICGVIFVVLKLEHRVFRI